MDTVTPNRLFAYPWLWGLIAGNGTQGGTGRIFFSAGSNDEAHRLSGSIEPGVPEPSTIVMLFAGGVALAAVKLLRRRS